MDIKGKGRFNLESFHKGKAGTVCKGEVLVIIFVKDLPASLPVNRGNGFYGEKGIGFDGITKFDGGLTAYGPGKKIEGFYKNQIGCKEITFLKNEIGIELTGYLCILIISIGYSDPCAGVNKDPHLWVLVRRFLP